MDHSLVTHIRAGTADEALRAALAALPSTTSKPYLTKLAHLGELAMHAKAPSITAIVLSPDIPAASRLLLSAAGRNLSRLRYATECVLVLLKHAYPSLPAADRAYYQRAWRQVHNAAKQRHESGGSDGPDDRGHMTKAQALAAAISRLPPGDTDRCLLVLLTRMAGRLKDGMIGRLHGLKVHDDRTGCDPAPAESVTEDFVYVSAAQGQSYMAFRDAGAKRVQARALLCPDVEMEIKASLDLRPRLHVFPQRGGHPYTNPDSFHKRMRTALRAALSAAGQVDMPFKDMLGVACNDSAVVQQALRARS